MSCSTPKTGIRNFLAVYKATYGFDDSQVQSVFHASLRRVRPAKNPPTVEKWQDLVDGQLYALALNDSIALTAFNRIERGMLRARNEYPPPNARIFAALRELPLRMEKAQSAIRRQVHAAAALRGVDPEVVQERFNAYRDQYQREFRHLPAAERPDPPEEWLHGYKKKDMMAVSSPQDAATCYAMYRCQADPTAFPDNPEQRFASIDLETAGPQGKTGLEPENGSIIEVGIAEYDNTGRKVGTYSQLVRPAPEVEAVCGTGAVDVHGITLEDVRDAPTWSRVAPEVTEQLSGRTMLIQNAMFEKDWLGHHMPAEGQPFDRYGPTVDTLCVARQHFSGLPNHRLETICTNVGVPYTNGHRALHDADVTAVAFFKMRERIYATWSEHPARAAAPHPPAGAGLRQPKQSRVQRITGADFDPTTADDPWRTPPATASTSVDDATPVGAPRAA